jgi:hypothetical protein
LCSVGKAGIGIVSDAAAFHRGREGGRDEDVRTHHPPTLGRAWSGRYRAGTPSELTSPASFRDDPVSGIRLGRLRHSAAALENSRCRHAVKGPAVRVGAKWGLKPIGARFADGQADRSLAMRRGPMMFSEHSESRGRRATRASVSGTPRRSELIPSAPGGRRSALVVLGFTVGAGAVLARRPVAPKLTQPKRAPPDAALGIGCGCREPHRNHAPPRALAPHRPDDGRRRVAQAAVERRARRPPSCRFNVRLRLAAPVRRQDLERRSAQVHG